MEETVLRVENLNKYFGITHANKDVTLELKAGKVHGFVGENGSGKSTLSSIICGMQKPDSGVMYKNGKVYAPANPNEANANKVSMVLQETGLIEKLPVSVNLYLGRTNQFKKFGGIDFRAMKKAGLAEMQRWDLGTIPMDVPVGRLSIEDQKIIELTRALSINPEVLILDEISQTLSIDRRRKLYSLLERLKKEGVAVLMISHDLEETLQVCDEITVLRDGAVVATVPTTELTLSQVKQMMVGREISGDYYRQDTEPSFGEEVILDVEGITSETITEPISFQLHKGEILGVCGLSDAGIHEVGKALYGLAGKNTGKVTHVPSGTTIKNPRAMINCGGAYLAKDRDVEGLMLDANILENEVLPSVKDMSGKGGFLRPRKLTELAKRAYASFDIKATGLQHTVRRLSGGNKQKVNLSRWLIRDLDFVILDCPTRGVDVGVKAYIYDVLRQEKENGLSILLISDELTEVLGMSDRVMVMKDGRLVDIKTRSADLTEEAIIEEMI